MDNAAAERGEDEFPAFYVTEIGATRIESGRVRDLTVHGARLDAERPLPPGTDIYIGIFLAKEEAPLVARARVVGWNAGTLTLEFIPGGKAQRDSIVRISDYLGSRESTDRAVG